MGQISIQGPQAFPVTSPSGSLITGQNVGLGNLYLGSTVNTGANNYDQLLDPGGRFTWPGDKALYVATDTGNVGTLSYTNNGATVIPGSSFSKATNLPVLIYQHSETINFAGWVDGNAVNRNSPVDVSTYSSVLIVLSIGGLPTSLQASNYIDLRVLEYDDLNAKQLGYVYQQNAQYLIDATGFNLGPPFNGYNTLTFQVPVTRSLIEINQFVYGGNRGVLPAQLPVGMSVYGLSQPLENPKYVAASASLMGNIPFGGIYQIASGNSTTVYTQWVATKNGLALATGQKFNTAQSFTYAIYDVQDGNLMQIVGIGAAANEPVYEVVPRQLILPSRPIQVVFQNQVGTNQTTGVLLQ